MMIDIDKLLSGMDGWDLALTIDGNAFTVEAPTNAAGEALQTILAADAVTEANRPDLEKLIAPLIHEPTTDVRKLALGQLVGIATATIVHAKEIRINHSRGICKSVVLAMRSGGSPKAPIAASPSAQASGQPKENPAALYLAAEARAAMEDYIKRLTGIAVPPRTSDADLGEIAVNAGKSAMRQAEQRSGVESR
jgi:hypothetical protein